MLNTIIFDLDGLLIDSEIIIYQIYCDLLNKFGYSFSKEEYASQYSGKLGIENMKNIINNYNLPITLQNGLDFVVSHEYEYRQKGIPLKNGAVELLNFLKENHYKIMLASSSKRERAEDILKQNRILQFFDDLVFGVEIKRGKPYPDIFLKACEKAGEPPENCLVLEDSEAGIQAAYSANIEVVCIPDMKLPEKKFQLMTKEILSSLLEVIPLLENKMCKI